MHQQLVYLAWQASTGGRQPQAWSAWKTAHRAACTALSPPGAQADPPLPCHCTPDSKPTAIGLPPAFQSVQTQPPSEPAHHHAGSVGWWGGAHRAPLLSASCSAQQLNPHSTRAMSTHPHSQQQQKNNHSSRQQQQQQHNSHRDSGKTSGRHPTCAAKALHHGIRSHLAEFTVTPQQAVRQFDRFQLQECKGFQVSGLLQDTPLTPTYLPFWSFDAVISARYTCQLKPSASDPKPGSTPSGQGSAAGGSEAWCSSGWAELLSRERIDHSSELMQVCASYLHTRQFSQAASKASAAAAAAAASPGAGPVGRTSHRHKHPTDAGSGAPHDHRHAGEEGGGGGGGDPTKGSASTSGRVYTRPLSNEEAASLGVPASPFVWGGAGEGSFRVAAGGFDAASRSQQGAAGAEQQGGAAQQAHGAGPGRAWVRMEDPTMPQGLAWHLALRALTRHLVQQATVHARGQHAGQDVKDVHVEVQVHSRSVMLAYVPLYFARYCYGTRYKQGTSGVIVPQMFDAMMCGTGTGSLYATPHVSPAKAALVGGVAAVTGLIGAVGAASLLSGSGVAVGVAAGAAWGTWAAEAAAAALIGSALAGNWARGLPQAAKNKSAEKQAAADREFYARYDNLSEQLNPQANPTNPDGTPKPSEDAGAKQDGDEGDGAREAYMLWLWSDADWRRWEGEEPWNWDPVAKRAEAEALWRRQMARPLERERHRVMRQMEAERERLADEKERQGTGAGRRFGRMHGAAPGHGRLGHGQAHRGPRDFLGYYKILGIDVAAEAGAEGPKPLAAEDIKAAFKTQAMLLHPDRYVAAEEDERKQAHIKFQKLQMAYDVLKDVEKRKLYDRGQLIH